MSGRPGQRKKTKQQRLAAALRENLKRRKAQAKKRKAGHTEGPEAGRADGGTGVRPIRRSHDSAGITEHK